MQFGTSGLLYRSNKLMYDKTTNTLWRQFTGEPVVGPLADSGIRLEVLPVTLTTWEEWLGTHPDTTVLDINTKVYPSRVYLPEDNPGSFYFDYFNSPGTMFPVWRRSPLLKTKEVVLGVRLEGVAKAYPLEALRGEPLVNDVVAGVGLVVITDPSSGAARAYLRGNYLFSARSTTKDNGSTVVVLDENSQPWRLTEEALVKEEDPSQRLARIPTHMAFWFGWYTFYPATLVYGDLSEEG